MFTKAKIYNLSLSLLLLQRQIVDPANDTSNECKVLNTNWDAAFQSAIETMDLDSCKTQKTLELVATDPVDFPEWKYVYKYPSNCARFRRIKSTVNIDNRKTRIPLQIAQYLGAKCIFTNDVEAIGEIIPIDVSLNALSASAAMTVAARLALMASPLIVGKGADRLRATIEKVFVVNKAEAMALDREENFNFEDPQTTSEFVEERLG